MSDWPHSPLHRLSVAGAYIVTCGTYLKAHHFRRTERLEFLHDALSDFADILKRPIGAPIPMRPSSYKSITLRHNFDRHQDCRDDGVAGRAQTRFCFDKQIQRKI